MHFLYFFDVFGTRNWFQSLLQALASNFPSKMLDLDAYLLNLKLQPKKQFSLYCFTIFSAVFQYIWPLARPNIAEKGAALVEKAKLSSRDQVVC